MPTWIVSALRGNPIQVYGNGEQTMDLIHAFDAVSAILAIMDNFSVCNGKIFEIGSGVETVANDLAELIKNFANSSSDIHHIPMRPGEDQYTRIVANIEPLCEVTSWKPNMALFDGIQDTIDWYANNVV